MLLSAGVFLSSAGILVEDWEVRGAHDAGVRRIINPICGTCYMVGGVIFIAATVLVIRYIYLIVVSF